MDRINLSDKIWGDLIRIFMDDEICLNEKMETEVCKKGFFVTKYISAEYDKQLTFNDCVVIAKENGFTEGTFYIMAENATAGTIYQYANCYDGEPSVSKYGTTIGYA